MRILLLTTRFFPHIGGVENVVENLAQKWSSNNEVCVITSKNAKFLTDIENPIEERNGYKVKRIWMAVPRSFLGYAVFPVRFILSLFALKKFIKEYKPDVINIHFLDDISIYASFAIALSYKVVINIHGNDIQVFAKKPFYASFIKPLLNSADKVIVNSKYMLNDLLSFNGASVDKSVVIPNGLNLKDFTHIKPKKHLDQDYIFFVGRLVNKKGVDILIKAFAKANISDLKLLIEGKGEELSDIKKLIKDLKQESNITLTEGLLNYEQKISAMKGSLFGVIPSRIEPFGIVALEYMASGVPVIVSKTGGLLDLIEDHKTGLFFENENVDQLAELIKKLYEDSNLRKKISENQMNSSSKFDWEDISKDYLNLFKEL
jgi:glycosyltransferase involved in cell wall biosynthesis